MHCIPVAKMLFDNAIKYLIKNLIEFGRCSFAMYSIFNWLYCICSLLFTILCYKYFIAHTVYLALIVTIVAWNGAVFYVDVFSVRGFRDDD